MAAARARAADSLLNYIPHDTPYAFVPDETSGNQSTARIALDELRVQMRPLTVQYSAADIAAVVTFRLKLFTCECMTDFSCGWVMICCEFLRTL